MAFRTPLKQLQAPRKLVKQMVHALHIVQARLDEMPELERRRDELLALLAPVSTELYRELDSELRNEPSRKRAKPKPKVVLVEVPATAPPVQAPQQLHTPPRKLTAKEQEAAADAALRAECKAVVFAACADTSNPIYTEKLAVIIRDGLDDAMIHSYMVQYNVEAEAAGLPTTDDQDAWYWAHFRHARGKATEADQEFLAFDRITSQVERQAMIGATA